MPRGVPKKKPTNGRRKKIAKQARRTVHVTMDPQTPPTNTLQEALMAKLALPAPQIKTATDARSAVLGMCAHALIEMQVTLQAVAQAAVQAPNYTDTEERN